MNYIIIKGFKIAKKKTLKPTEVILEQKLVRKFAFEQKHVDFPLILTHAIIGIYIVDFFFPHKHLIVEINGKHQATDEGRKYDDNKDKYLKQIGFDVLRYTNIDIYQKSDEIVDYISDWASLENSKRNISTSRVLIYNKIN
jgi:very-short-patch-repair endonuclease